MTDAAYVDKGPAPTGLPYMSPSRMEKDDTCPRAYALRYIDGIKAPDKPTAAFGTRVHAQLERYFRTRVWPTTELVDMGNGLVIDVAQVAISGLHFLPTPDASLLIEHEWDCEVRPGYWYTGKIDIYDHARLPSMQVNHDASVTPVWFEVGEFSDEDAPADWKALDSRGLPIPVVIDHKSTGDFKNMKTHAQLRKDPQPGFYGVRAVRDFEGKYGVAPEWVHFRWVYYLRQKGESRAKCIDLRLTPAEIYAIADQWIPTADEIYSLHKIGKSGHDVPPKTSGCMKYGGCEYGPPKKWSPGNLNICRLTSGDRMRAAMTNPFGTPAPANPTASPFGAPAATQPAGLAAQVAAHMASQVTQPAGAASPFGALTPPETPRTAPPAASPFGGISIGGAPAAQPAAQAAFVPPAPTATPFGAAQPAAFGGISIGGAPATAPVTAGPLSANTHADFFAPPAAIPVVADPRLAEIPASIDPARHVEWLKHCDANALDHRTGQLRASAPAFVPPAAAAPTDPEAFKTIAQKIYDEGRRPDPATSHPTVCKMFEALETMFGPKNIPPAPAAEPKRRGRKPRAQANGEASEDDDNGVPVVLVTTKAIDELVAFLLSLKTSAIDVDKMNAALAAFKVQQ